VNDETSQPSPRPVSNFLDPIESLLASGLLSPPDHPGVRARLGQYEILKLLGVGGMGVVLLARTGDRAEPLAIKLLKPELLNQPRVLHRFLVEARHLQTLTHPHLVPVLAVSDDALRPHFVMPFLERSVASLIKPSRPLDEESILGLAGQLAEALQYVHTRGIIHRDVKPANVLLAADGRVLLADFGLAQTLLNDSTLDFSGERFEGTAAYVSPQVAGGEAEDTRCDIYAFGALLYEMLTGGPPYKGHTTKEVLKQILAGPPPAILILNPKASAALARIAEAAMAREHRARYANMADIIADLTRIKHHQAPLGPHRRWKPMVAWVRPLAATVVLVGALSVWLALSHWHSRPRLEPVRQLESPLITDWTHTRLGQWDGDGEADLFVTQQDQWYVLSSRNQMLSRPHPNEPAGRRLAPGLVTDIDGDGLDELFLSWPEGTNVTLAAYNANRWPVAKFHISGTVHEHPVHGLNYTALRAEQMVDLDGDGSSEILATVHTGWGLKPRGLACFSVRTQELLWQYPVAPWPLTVVVADINGDGKREVLLGSNATANGNRLPDGTDDAHCYVYAFGDRGQLLWRTEAGTVYTMARPFVVKSGDGPRPFAWIEALPENRATKGESEVGTIVALESSTGRISQQYDARVRLLSCLATDLNCDGRPEILATDRLGFVHVLNEQLELLKKVNVVSNRLDSVCFRLLGVTNLSARPFPQVTATAYHERLGSGRNMGGERSSINVRLFRDAELLILDHELTMVVRYPLGEKWSINPDWAGCLADVDGDHVPEIVVFGAQEAPVIFAFRE
jgi:serine/threonine-protein kinase